MWKALLAQLAYVCLRSYLLACTFVCMYAGVIVDYATPSNLAFLPLLRVLRVARIFKLIPKARGLRMMLQTFVW